MISKKYYQELLSPVAFKRDYSKTEEDLFNYIIESEINGNYSQVREFINKLSSNQFKLFCNWFVGQNLETKPLNWFISFRG